MRGSDTRGSSTKQGCVITGVAGFVGSHLARGLLAKGLRVIGVDNLFSGRWDNIASLLDHPSFVFHQADIREQTLLERLKSAYPETGHCFHLAAIVSVPYSLEHPEDTMEINYQAAMHLLEEADRLDFTSFVFAGSAAEYGNDGRMPLREEYATGGTRHLSAYGRAKFLTSERVAANPRGVALRFFNIYGPGQDPDSPYSGVISRFVARARKGEPLKIFGDGEQTRDFIYISDVVDACILAAGLEGRGTAGGVYNVATGKSTSILELADIIGELYGGTGRMYLPQRSGDIRHSLAAIDKFHEAVGWKAAVRLREGLRY